jgi:predicted regulator of Ras-like GTPase activity (Roadblock/LC7/MglB family)
LDHRPEVRPVESPLPTIAGIKIPQPATVIPAAKPAPVESPATARAMPMPGDIVERACRLTGVAGAVVATLDGLAVASQLPSGIPADRISAFLPQAFSRLAQFTKELNLGEPTQLEILVEKLPLQIYKTAACYFGVLGKSGDPLPKAQLSVLASQLSARTNS